MVFRLGELFCGPGGLALGAMQAKVVTADEEYVSDSVWTWITFKGKIISTRDGRLLWETEELYYDPKCEYVEEMQNNPEIVVDMLTRSVHGIAVNTVNEIQ